MKVGQSADVLQPQAPLTQTCPVAVFVQSVHPVPQLVARVPSWHVPDWQHPPFLHSLVFEHALVHC
jgi:hypothetical protein